MSLPADITVQHEPAPSEETINAAADLYTHLMKDNPAFLAAVSGRLELGPQMARGLIKPAALVCGEMYTAKDADGTLVGFTIWLPPGRNLFDTPEQFAMGFSGFLEQMNDASRAYQKEVIGETMPRFIDGCLGIENAEEKTYWCWLAMVSEGYQRKGLCRAMFQLVIEKAKTTNATMGLLTDGESNVEVYQKLGFELKGEQKMTSPWSEWTFCCMARKAIQE